MEQLIEAEERAGIPSSRIIVGGFSQGGAVALLMLRSHKKLAGVVGLSTYLALTDEEPLVSEANKETPLLQAHGDADPVVRPAIPYSIMGVGFAKELSYCAAAVGNPALATTAGAVPIWSGDK